MPQQPHPHRFGRLRPSRDRLRLTQRPTHSGSPFQPLPPPTGAPPFHLDLADIVTPATLASIKKARSLIFHTAGDTGGINDATPQQIVADSMEQQFDHTKPPAASPVFLYVLGDCVYFYGEASQYFPQFYHPYEFYPGPIFAVPGNHDGDVQHAQASLEAFVRNFCASGPATSPDAGGVPRTTMVQPNVFWTLDTPFATFVGLYTNVPEGGRLDAKQQAWFTRELSTAPKNKALLVTMHHPVYSGDNFHSGSPAMRQALTDAVKSSKRHPDMVLAGHVHNYQRFTRTIGGKDYPFIVAGAGGYHNLHSMAKVNGQVLIPPVHLTDDGDDVTLESVLADRHGFLQLEVTPDVIRGQYFGVPRPQESRRTGTRLVDSFTLQWKTHKLTA